MARIYQKPTVEQLLKELDEEHKDTINKMLEIQDILLVRPPNDKSFNKYAFNYISDYVSILNKLELTDYSDEQLQRSINSLYDKIFKKRR